MVTANVVPTYYRVTFDGTNPTNYNSLTGDQAGGLDLTHAERYNRTVRIVGSVNSTGWSIIAGDSITINEVQINFGPSANPSLSEVIGNINDKTRYHGVFAYAFDTNYLGLMNAPHHEGEPITIGSVLAGVLDNLGIQEGIYTEWPSAFGSFGGLINAGSQIKINGVTVTMTAGPAVPASATHDINLHTAKTNVIGRVAGSGIQLVSKNGQPFSLSDVTVGTWAKMGFTVGNYGGAPTTLAESLAKERATMRWDAMIIELGQLISPVYLDDIVKTGNLDGSDAPDSISFTVGYDRASYLRVEDVNAPGTYFTGADAVKRLVATALYNSYTSNQEIFDPTITTTGDTCARMNPTQIMQITAAGIDDNIVDIEGNITVTEIVLV